MRKTLAIFVLLALALAVWMPAQAQQSQTQPATPQKPAGAAPAKPKSAGKKKMMTRSAGVLGTMSETAGCHILNKGKRGQICYYDVNQLRPENKSQQVPDAPIYISVNKHESIIWHKGGGIPFHVVGIELKPNQNPGCPKQAFDNDFKDDPTEPWHEALSSGWANSTAGHYGCEYKTHVKWQDGKIGDPHIIINDDN